MVIMELVPGGSLEPYLQQKGRDTSIDERVMISCQAARAVQYLHKVEILHRFVDFHTLHAKFWAENLNL